MKDLKVYDGSGWQSLKGPPGPSAVSVDSGNKTTLGSDSLVYCPAVVHTSSATLVVQEGDDFASKYNQAKSLTPGGQPLSTTNRACLLVMPGNYRLTALLTINAEFVDIYGTGGALYNPAVTLTGNTVNVTADDVRISNLSVGSQRFGVTGDKPKQVFYNCRGTGIGSFGQAGSSGMFLWCYAGASAFTLVGEAKGIYRHCIAGSTSFGPSSTGGKATGSFYDCFAENASFGNVGGASGRFERCTASAASFGGAPTCVDCSARYWNPATPVSAQMNSFSHNPAGTGKTGGIFVMCELGEQGFSIEAGSPVRYTNCWLPNGEGYNYP